MSKLSITEGNSMAQAAEKPDSAATGAVVIDAERCKGCGLCNAACARGVLAMSSRLNARSYTPAEVRHPEKCTGCQMCALMCPEVAIRVYRSRQKKAARKS